MTHRIRAILVLLGFCFQLINGQEDSVAKDIPLLSLQLEQMNYKLDSSNNKIISAGKISKNLEEIPLQVYVITHDEIINNQYTTLTDVLSSLPGIVVSKPGTGEIGESFQMWNLTGNQYTKFLINGVAIKPSVVSGMPIGAQLPIRQAERIEVIYGNSSAIYGADAVAGVINIITKSADKTSFARGDISLAGAGDNLINFTIGGKGGKNNKILEYTFYGSKTEVSELHLDYSEEGLYNPLNYYLSAGDSLNIEGNWYKPNDVSEDILGSEASSDSFINEYYGGQYEGTWDEPDMEALGSASNMLGLQLKYKDWSLNYNYMYRRTHSSLGLSPVYYKYNNPQNYWGENIQLFALERKKERKNYNTITQFNSLAYTMDNNSSQGLTFLKNNDKAYRYSASNDIEMNHSYSFSPLEGLEVVAGIGLTVSGNLPSTNYRIKPFNKSWYFPFSTEIDSSHFTVFERFGVNPVVFSTTSAHMQAYYSRGKFRLLGGLRYDISTLYGDKVSPHFALMHQTSKRTSLRFSIGTAFKAPSTSVIYQSLAYKVSDTILHVVSYPNTKLLPEKFSTSEFGFTTHFSKRFSLHQTFFAYQITNHIVPISLPASQLKLINIENDSVSMWFNTAGTVSTIGGSQTTLKFTNIIPSVRLNVEASFYFQERRDEFPNLRAFAEKYVSVAPSHSGKLKVNLQPRDKMFLYIESHWMSKWLRVVIPFDDLYENIFGEEDGYYAMNATARFMLSDQLDAFVKINNIFNEKYGVANSTQLEESLLYNPQLTRSIRFGLTYRMN